MIELQHSYLKHEEVIEREAFYGRMCWVFNTEPWRFRAWIAPDGVGKFRWLSSRRTLDAVKSPVFLDLGGPLIRVTSYGPRGCVSGFGEVLSRADFVQRIGLRPYSDEELAQPSHFSLLQRDGNTFLARSPESLRHWNSPDGKATRHDLGGRTTLVDIPEIPIEVVRAPRRFSER